MKNDTAIENSIQEPYGFFWPGKHAAAQAAMQPTATCLRPMKAGSVAWATTQNLFIRGNNLDALKHLSASGAGTVDVIFIDPPYNTGSKAFGYEDDFRMSAGDYRKISDEDIPRHTEASARLHSAWCSMLYPLLILSKTLLRDDGVIFITLDDGENAQTRMMLNEVFGEDNFITEFVWEKKKKPSFLHRNVGKLFDYVLCYAKNAASTGAFSVEKTTAGKKYPLNNAGNGMGRLVFPPQSVDFGFEKAFVRAQDMSGGNVMTLLENDLVVENHTNQNTFSLLGEWRYSQARLDQVLREGGCIHISKLPFRPNHIKPGGDAKKLKNMLTSAHYSIPTNEDATAQLAKLFGAPVFDTPKPVGLVKLLLKAVTQGRDNALVLDFFAGSATTAHAVMELNAEALLAGSGAGGHRFIMVQLPEPVAEGSAARHMGLRDIADIGAERIRRAGSAILAASPALAGKLDTGFRLYQLVPQSNK